MNRLQTTPQRRYCPFANNLADSLALGTTGRLASAPSNVILPVSGLARVIIQPVGVGSSGGTFAFRGTLVYRGEGLITGSVPSGKLDGDYQYARLFDATATLSASTGPASNLLDTTERLATVSGFTKTTFLSDLEMRLGEGDSGKMDTLAVILATLGRGHGLILEAGTFVNVTSANFLLMTEPG